MMGFGFIETVVSELESIDWVLESISNSMDSITLSHLDHIIQFSLPTNYPNQSCCFTSDIPPSLMDLEHPITMSQVVKAFMDHLDAFNLLAKVMKDIKKLSVLDHQGLKYRIALEDHCTLQFELNPSDPTSFPTISSLMGPEAALAKVRSSLSNAAWNSKESTSSNLKRILLLSSKERGHIKDAFECGICMSFKLGDTIPSVLCSNSKCAKGFHSSCLLEWFRSLPTTRQSFHLTIGTCPFCNQVLPLSSRT